MTFLIELEGSSEQPLCVVTPGTGVPVFVHVAQTAEFVESNRQEAAGADQHSRMREPALVPNYDLYVVSDTPEQ